MVLLLNNKFIFCAHALSQDHCLQNRVLSPDVQSAKQAMAHFFPKPMPHFNRGVDIVTVTTLPMQRENGSLDPLFALR